MSKIHALIEGNAGQKNSSFNTVPKVLLLPEHITGSRKKKLSCYTNSIRGVCWNFLKIKTNNKERMNDYEHVSTFFKRE